MPYSAESLAALSDMKRDDVVAELVMDREPEPGPLPWLRRRAVRRYAQTTGGEALSYRGSAAGMGLVCGALGGKGFTVGLAPGGIVWVTGQTASQHCLPWCGIKPARESHVTLHL
jgi:hypothetical protein